VGYKTASKVKEFSVQALDGGLAGPMILVPFGEMR
jgi:hypothetical protein